MPVSYQSWEMASGASVAYKLGGRTSGCIVVEGPKGSNFSNFRVQDTMSRGFGETPKSSNYRVSSPQDNVVWGLSALSLRGQSQPEADSPSEDNRGVSLGAFFCASPDPFGCMSPRSTESPPFALAQSSGCWKPLNSGTHNTSFVSGSNVSNQATTMQLHESLTGNFSHVDCDAVRQRAPLIAAYCVAAPRSFHGGDEVDEHNNVGSLSDMLRLRSSNASLHSTSVSVSKDNGVEPDTMSESSVSSGKDAPVASSSSSGEASQLSDDTEIQSAYKEPADTPCSVGASSPPRKGLSRFYDGKSRSFSYLRDVVSVKDLAKPEIPHSKRRRASSGSSGLPPLQKGASSIAKKPLHSGKSTLALAVAMNRKEDYEAQASGGPSTYQTSPVPSRSYSLSDLQGVTGSIFFIG